MTVLVLRLAGPLQSWGSFSRFARRTTGREPTKSGVVGLLAAALGRRRTDSIEDLLSLRFGVRLDQPGRLVRDFQTARTLDGAKPMPLSYRYYLGDAAFLAGVEADHSLLETLDTALRNPTFPLYLGRRSCPPVGPVTLGLREGDVVDVLRTEPWQAAKWWQRRRDRDSQVELELVMDAEAGEGPPELRPDAPRSFDPRHRMYGLRAVSRERVTVPNPSYRERRVPAHDPFLAWEE